MKTTIKTLKSLVRALSMCKGDMCVVDIMQQSEIPVSEVEAYCSWNSERYTRNLIAKTEDVEVLLICWEAGQSSPIHDFDSHEAWVHPISGRLREEKFIPGIEGEGLVKAGSMSVWENDFSYMRNVSAHRFTNIFGARTISIAVFAPPITHIRVYDEETGTATSQPVSYDKTFDLLSKETSTQSV
ncbi:MAG: cysteine dioxygenase family protein [Flavobacteriales bacterium]|nr:cysteine dioxygenase family protein [Flavobacteriales bacterium]